MTTGILDRTSRLVKQNEAEEQQRQRDAERREFARLVSILRKGDEATDADAKILAEVCGRRGLTEQRLQEIVDVIGEATKLGKLVDEWDSANKAQRAANERLEKAREAVTKANEERKAAAEAADGTTRRAQLCHKAPRELRNRASRNRQLFDESDPPKLLGT